MARNLQKLSVDDLTTEIVRLTNAREALRVEQLEVSRIRDAKLTEQYERERLTAAGFSQDRIDAIVAVSLQAIAPEAQSNG